MAKRWECDECKRRFNSRLVGSTHILRKHGNVTPEPEMKYKLDFARVSRSLDKADYYPELGLVR